MRSASRVAGVLKALLGTVAGFVTTTLFSLAVTTLLRLLFEVARASDPPGWYQAIDLAYSMIAMAVGGLVAARVGQRRAAFFLATLVLVLGIVTAVGDLDPVHPLAYQWAIAILGPVAVLLGSKATRSLR